jgi:hypothetical protein
MASSFPVSGLAVFVCRGIPPSGNEFSKNRRQRPSRNGLCRPTLAGSPAGLRRRPGLYPRRTARPFQRSGLPALSSRNRKNCRGAGLERCRPLRTRVDFGAESFKILAIQTAPTPLTPKAPAQETARDARNHAPRGSQFRPDTSDTSDAPGTSDATDATDTSDAPDAPDARWSP